ncbi:MAG: hypothetical protein WBQ17_11105 [Rhizomicrobium sp.]
METVAHYRLLKAWSQVVFVFLVLALVPYITFESYGGHIISRALSSALVIPAIAFGWIMCIPVLLMVIAVMMQLLFQEGKAVWIKDGMLIFVHRRLFCARCNQISKIAMSANGQTIEICMHNGSKKIFPAGSLKESCNEIVERLTGLLDLPHKGIST